MKNRLVLILIASLLTGFDAFAQFTDGDKQFDQFKELFLDKYWELNPGSATYQGYSKYDHLLPTPDEATNKSKLKKYEQLQSMMGRISPNELSASNRTDYYVLENLLASDLWYLTEYRAFEWNPTYYNMGGQFDAIMNSDRAMDQKVGAIESKLNKVPAYLEAAKTLLTNPTLEHAQLALQQFKGSMGIFEKDIPQLFSKYQSSSNSKKLPQKELDQNLKEATNAMKSFIKWLDNDLISSLKKDNNRRSFRLGKTLYEKKFEYDIVSDYSSAEIYDKGKREVKEIHKKMKKITSELWAKYFEEENADPSLDDIKTLIDKISQKHVSRDQYFSYIKKQIPELEKFVQDNNLLDLDPDQSLKVRPTPEYMRGGGAGASISAPGPYEKDRPTYYNVTPLDRYSANEAESYLQEYNDYILQILNIHEAVPGHYTQLVYANKSPSIIKSLFGNGAMIEGWACYVERMMLEEGYGNHEPEMWLMYYKWNLREICNTLIDIGVHTKGMKQEEVMDLLVRQAFQEAPEAEGKWKRLTLTQVQLCSYYTGLTEIYELREDIKNQKGENFDLKLFHTEFLSYGSSPVKYIRQLLGQ